MKPFSLACENNKIPITAVLKLLFSDRKNVLEIGSGTGQHAVFFGEQMPHLCWQCGDLRENHHGILQWLEDARLDNVLPPMITDADLPLWSFGQFDAVFSANTLHIMSWQQVINIFQRLQDVLLPEAKIVIYGPFKYEGNFTSESNARFDQWLKQQVPHQGIRDFEAVNKLANEAGLRLLADHDMPANNRLLCWQKG